jgi:hypothetical protein
MAKVTLHPAIQRLSGATGGLVFRHINDKTVASRRAAPGSNTPSPAQSAQRERFRQAAAYARNVLADTCQKRVYAALARERGRRVDKLVESDFLTPPWIEAIEPADYRGRAGAAIRVLAFDDVEVVAVSVAILTAEDRLLEEGAAEKVHGVWVYRTTTDAPAGAALTVTATARDRPGNRSAPAHLVVSETG